MEPDLKFQYFRYFINTSTYTCSSQQLQQPQRIEPLPQPPDQDVSLSVPRCNDPSTLSPITYWECIEAGVETVCTHRAFEGPHEGHMLPEHTGTEAQCAPPLHIPPDMHPLWRRTTWDRCRHLPCLPHTPILRKREHPTEHRPHPPQIPKRREQREKREDVAQHVARQHQNKAGPTVLRLRRASEDTVEGSCREKVFCSKDALELLLRRNTTTFCRLRPCSYHRGHINRQRLH